MDWIEIVDESDIDNIKSRSFEKVQVIFKHSTACSISSMAKNRLEKWPESGNLDFYYLDLIKYRNISNSISNIFQVHHQSPQILVVKNGECVFDVSHLAINMEDIIEHAEIVY